MTAPLPDRLRRSADALTEVSALYGYPSPEHVRWTADDLRAAAADIQAGQPLTDTEEWRPVVGYEGSYEVSSHGRVRSLDRDVVTYRGWVTRRPGKILRAYKNRSGYRTLTLWVHSKPSLGVVHVLVAKAFLGPRPPGMECCHNDGDPGNNHVKNLRWATPSANHQDTRLHGTNHELNKTHCPQGHEYNSENTYLCPVGSKQAGHRKCRQCNRDRHARRSSLRKSENTLDAAEREGVSAMFLRHEADVLERPEL